MSRIRTQVYLDHAATSPMLAKVQDVMRAVEGEAFGNASSAHWAGDRALAVLDSARRAVLGRFGGGDRVIFTSGATESNLIGLLGTALGEGFDRIVVSAIEHESVNAAARLAERLGISVERCGVDELGRLDLEELNWRLSGGPAAVGVVHASNEVGTVQPVAQIAELVHARGSRLHLDLAQSFGKVAMTEARAADTWGISGHKIGGPKGIGALIIGSDVRLESPIGGGSQEDGLRHGTHNVAGAAGLACAAVENDPVVIGPELQARADHLRSAIAYDVPDIRWTGDPENRAPHLVSAIVPGVPGEMLVASLDVLGIAASVGSACAARKDPSGKAGALRAMGASKADAVCSVRFSVGLDTASSEISSAAPLITETIHRLREVVSAQV
ncbi:MULTISPECIES: cysteine desulfurase family protein [unclassified Nocardioides]|uniref:cysteine desulfurase family protein n=1 Tax=unclassified Nocardioides TaxID=2615069 RepID=UPI0009EFFC63|nr:MULTISPECIES: aminotransferase class V-fold PLP-dependent enzyme [unclassified Nocardioides]GAW51841.1 Aminotransferase class V [Nocardioides sp. PD653-B2]GAW53505.1 Aminotransferase class V [Nocardioides sp. PD653]